MPRITSFNLVVLRGWQQQNRKGKRQRREGGSNASRPSVRCGQEKSRGERLGDGRIDRWKGKKRKTWGQKWHLLKAIHLSAMRDDGISHHRMVIRSTAAVLNWRVATQKWVTGLFWQDNMVGKKNMQNANKPINQIRLLLLYAQSNSDFVKKPILFINPLSISYSVPLHLSHMRSNSSLPRRSIVKQQIFVCSVKQITVLQKGLSVCHCECVL